MSKDFTFDRDDADWFEIWNTSSGVYSWVFEFISANVTDPAIVARIDEVVGKGYGAFGLTYFDTPEQAAEVVEVIRGPLLAAARHEHPHVLWQIEELAEMATRWSESA
ncbi:MAG TPA: hypothetical protein VNO31_15160 [Umezawaea sp.]|nr:hypothetical protein [Umezawaea sp.]